MSPTVTPDWSQLGPIAQAIIIAMTAVVAALAGVVSALYLALIKEKDKRIEDGLKYIVDSAVKDEQILEAFRTLKERVDKMPTYEILARDLQDIKNACNAISRPVARRE